MSDEKSFNAHDLGEFLQQNPRVFQQHPELLEHILLSDSRGSSSGGRGASSGSRSTSSLLERQIAVLKERLIAQKMSQTELFQNARDNEEISNQFSDVISQLIGCTNLSEFAADFPRVLRQTFAIDQVSIKTAHSVTRRPSESASYEETIRRLNGNRSLCDDRWPSSIMRLFFNDDIQSAALIPLHTHTGHVPLGVLALGSRDSSRYTHDLGTAHLDRLGLMAGICLKRLQPKLHTRQEDTAHVMQEGDEPANVV